MAFKSGDPVPKAGEVRCVQHPDVTATVNAGDTFPTPGHFGENEACEWEYASPN